MRNKKPKLKELKNNQCRECLNIKAPADFRHNRRVCKECESLDQKDRYYKNQDREIARSTKWNKENPDKKARNNRTYDKKHPERQERFLTWADSWRESNKNILSSYTRKYQSQKKNACPDWLTKDDIRFMKLFYKESSRLTQETGIRHHVDHIIPLQGKNVSGLHVPWNLQILTESENCRKQNQL